MGPIQSADNPAVKRLGRLLAEPKERRALASAVCEGPRLLDEALRSGRPTELWATPEALESGEAPGLLERAAERGLKPRLLSAALVKRLSGSPAPQGWLTVVEASGPAWPQAATLCLALDGVQDPGNLGTLLRAAWAAKAAVLLGAGCADPWSPKVLRSGAGAQFSVPVQAGLDLASRLPELRRGGMEAWSAEPRGAVELWDADLRKPVCLVLGAEGPGVSAAVGAACQGSLKVPYPGGAESLNVAVTGTLMLFEALRQRRKA